MQRPNFEPNFELVASLIKRDTESFDAKIDEVNRLMQDTLNCLENTRLEYHEMMLQLSERLARKQRLRHKDFNSIFGYLLVTDMENKEACLHAMAAEFYAQKKEMVHSLKNLVTTSQDVDINSFFEIKEKALNRNRQTERQLAQRFREHHIEQEELGVGLAKLVSMGEEITVEALRKTAGAIQVMRKERLSQSEAMLGHLRAVSEDIARDWDEVMSVFNG